MNEPDPLDALFARARQVRPDTSRAEYGFETRLLAHLREQPLADSAWSWVAWRLAPLFAAIVAVLLFWQVQVASATEDAEQSSYAQTNLTVESLGSFN